jgi:uncharacterized protein
MSSSFLGWQFESVELSQREPLEGFLTRNPQALSGFTFASLASWNPIFRYGWTLAEPETLLISCQLDPDPHRHLMQPVGRFPSALQEQLIREAASLPYGLKLIGVTEEFLGNNTEFAKHFQVREDPAAANYIYLTENLSRLPGRKYAKKRNLLSQAGALYQWRTAPIAASNTGACFEVLQRIQEEEQPEIDANLQQELIALDRTLRLWNELGQEGIVLTIEERPVAFSVYEPLSPTTVAVHFERALRSYKGLYQVINWETARIIASRGYEYMNREEDLGSPGLREAKRSYAPVRLVPAYELIFY